MKVFALSVLAFFLLQTSASLAQPASVDLKDGSGTLIGSYDAISAAYAAIPAVLTQAYTIELKSNYTADSESYPIRFGEKTGASSSNTITLRPAAGVTGTSISADVYNDAVLRLDGADYIIIDGRAGGMGTTPVFNWTNTDPYDQSDVILLDSGATHNIIRYCILNDSAINYYYNTPGGVPSGGNGSCLRLNNIDQPQTWGNSDNLFEYNITNGGQYAIFFSDWWQQGTVGGNDHNKIYGCQFNNFTYCGVDMGAALSSGLIIDSCSFYSVTENLNTEKVGIWYNSWNDSALITRNRIFLSNKPNAAGLYVYDFIMGIYCNAQSNTSYSYIANNFIDLLDSGAQYSYVDVRGITASSGAYNGGLSIVNNTVRVRTNSVSSSLFQYLSSCLLLSNYNNGNCTVKNNIFINEDAGNSSSTPNTCVYFTYLSALGLSSDYNTYQSSSGAIAFDGANYYNSVSALQAISAPGNESHSNIDTVHLAGTGDLHLVGSSIGDSLLYGIAIPGLTNDIDNESRLVPYRGADEEPGPHCTGKPYSTQLYNARPVICIGDTAVLAVLWDTSEQSLSSSIGVQWQSSADGSNFSDIAGAIHDTLRAPQSDTVYYRYVLTCNATGLTNASVVVAVAAIARPVVDSLTEVHNGLSYTFTAHGVRQSTGLSWIFGDDTAVVNNADTTMLHSYAAAGAYTVTVIARNDCGSDTVLLSSVQPSGVEQGPLWQRSFSLYPNPTHDRLYLSFGGGIRMTRLLVRNSTGALVKEVALQRAAQTSVEVAGWPAGLYLLTVETDEGMLNRSFLIE